MRAPRVVLAFVLAAGPVQAQPVVELLARYSVPADETAASVPEGDAPQGSGKRLAALEADLALVSEALEGFAHPQDADKALLAAKPRLPEGAVPFFRDRATALDALYRTLAVVDNTWALRFANAPCAPAAKRSALLRSEDGLFTDPSSGKTSAWMKALLGPSAKGKDLESALDQASVSVAPSQAEYARLRARQNLITKALAAEAAVGEARAKLYCKRAETRVKLAAANRVTGPVLAARSSGEGVSRHGLVILAGKTAEGLEARGAGGAAPGSVGMPNIARRSGDYWCIPAKPRVGKGATIYAQGRSGAPPSPDGEEEGDSKKAPIKSIADLLEQFKDYLAVLKGDRLKHILFGDETGGGHKGGLGKSGKSEFPKDWSDAKVEQTIRDIANDPASSANPGANGRIIVQGTLEGVDVRIILQGATPSTRDQRFEVITAYPTNIPPNP